MVAPKLRFKEFTVDWKKTTIDKSSTLITSGSRDWAKYYSTQGDKFIRMTNLVRNGIHLDLTDLKCVKLPKSSNEGQRTKLYYEDILISITAELGKLGWIPDNLGTAYINQHTALVRPNKELVHSQFIAHLLSTEKYNLKLNKLNDSGAKSGLNLSTIRDFIFFSTTKDEQTRIANFLSAVDERIQQVSQTHALLTQYKKGVMQKIFSQELRFKDENGEEFGAWESTELGKLTDVRDGTHDSPKQCDEGYPLITSKNLLGSGGIDFSNITYISLDDYNSINKRSKVEIGDLLFSMIGTIGNIAIVKECGFAIKNVALIRKNKNVINDFLFFYLQYVNSIGYFDSIKTGNTQKFVSLSMIRNLKIHTPTLPEQTKIANFLSSIDDKINQAQSQLTALQEYKRGLLQQMFI